MERSEATKDKLAAIQEECEEVTNEYTLKKFIEMMEQTRKIKMLVENLKDWEELYRSLRNLKDKKLGPNGRSARLQRPPDVPTFSPRSLWNGNRRKSSTNAAAEPSLTRRP